MRVAVLGAVVALAAMAVQNRITSSGTPVLAATAAAAEVSGSQPLALKPPLPLALNATGANAGGRGPDPTLPCDDNPETATEQHLLLDGTVSPGAFSSVAGTLRTSLSLHQAGASIDKGTDFLDPAASHVTIGNDRGTLRFRLGGGGCGSPNAFPSANGLGASGRLTLIGGTGSYDDAAAGGQWNLTSQLSPGHDGNWTVNLNGQVQVQTPGLAIAVARTYWANLGIDYLARIVTADYTVTNTGPGDSYGTTLQAATSPTAGVTVLSSGPGSLGDLHAGESTTVTVRYQLALLGPPCALIVLNCKFTGGLTVNLPDALDTPTALSATAPVTAPNLPPPL